MRDAQDIDVLTGPGSGFRRPLLVSLPTAAAVVAVDQATKWWVLETLAPGTCDQPDACIDLIGGLRLNLVFNTGAAFTTGTGFGPVLGVLALILSVVLIVWSTRRTDRLGVFLIGAVAGGAVGNLIDRAFRADDGPLTGAVIDFIDLQWWPVFNVADSAIVVGVIGLIAHAFLVGDEPASGRDGDDRGATDRDGLDRGDDDRDGADHAGAERSS